MSEQRRIYKIGDNQITIWTGDLGGSLVGVNTIYRERNSSDKEWIAYLVEVSNDIMWENDPEAPDGSENP